MGKNHSRRVWLFAGLGSITILMGIACGSEAPPGAAPPDPYEPVELPPIETEMIVPIEGRAAVDQGELPEAESDPATPWPPTVRESPSSDPGLPWLSGVIASCVPPLPGTYPGPRSFPVSACAWAQSTDAIVWGTVRELRLVDHPAVASWSVSNPHDRWRDDCVATVPALNIEIEVEIVLFGDITPRALTVHMGSRHLGKLNPPPQRGIDGRAQWPPGAERKLEEGQQLGLALHYFPGYDLWSLMGEKIFALDERGLVAFQRGGHVAYCGTPPYALVDVEGWPLDLLQEKLSSCTEFEPISVYLRQNIESTWGHPLVQEGWMAATCLRREADFD